MRQTDTWTCSDFQELKLTRKFQHHQGVVKGWKTAVTGEKWFYVWKPSHAMMAKLIPLVTLCTAPASRKDCVQPAARSEIGTPVLEEQETSCGKGSRKQVCRSQGLANVDPGFISCFLALSTEVDILPVGKDG